MQLSFVRFNLKLFRPIFYLPNIEQTTFKFVTEMGGFKTRGNPRNEEAYPSQV